MTAVLVVLSRMWRTVWRTAVTSARITDVARAGCIATTTRIERDTTYSAVI